MLFRSPLNLGGEGAKRYSNYALDDGARPQAKSATSKGVIAAKHSVLFDKDSAGIRNTSAYADRTSFAKLARPTRFHMLNQINSQSSLRSRHGVKTFIDKAMSTNSHTQTTPIVGASTNPD